MTEVQKAVNERPLSYRDSDVANLEILTSNSFLKIGSCSDISFGSLEGSDLLIPNRKDLILTLYRRDDFVTLGDVFLLYSPVKSRVNCSLGRVTGLLTGSDGKTK